MWKLLEVLDSRKRKRACLRNSSARIATACLLLVLALTGNLFCACRAEQQPYESNPNSSNSYGDDTLVQTKSGPVRGFRVNGTVSFLGIPFAKPPVGTLRFTPPTPAEPWKDVLNATQFAPGCPQICKLPSLMCPTHQSEDCLYLNVYIPDKLPPPSGFPVYTFIHGGSYNEGAGGCTAYNGREFAKHDVILVNMNYRLGALGWLSHTDKIKGNFGLQDQRLALQWVQDNIRSFGGDPTRVTMGGESAGGISVLTHLASPFSTGLFHRAVIESGPIALPFNEYGKTNRIYEKFVSEAKCSDSHDVMSCLQLLPIDHLIEIQENLTVIPLPVDTVIHLFLPWMPTFELLELPLHPYMAFKEGDFNRVPLLAGSNKEDARPFVYATLDDPVDIELFSMGILALFGEHSIDVMEEYKDYTRDKDNREALKQMGTDLLFTCSVRFIADSMRKHAGVPTWLYNFGYGFVSPFWGPYIKWCNGHACHGVELPFVFDLFAEGDLPYNRTKDDAMLGSKVIQYWAEFAAAPELNQTSTLSPDPELLPEWTQYDSQDQVWMNFTSAVSPNVTGDFRKPFCDMFDSFGYMLWQ